jgi:RNA polymerase sigma-70 factor (ECF subfamily)
MRRIDDAACGRRCGTAVRCGKARSYHWQASRGPHMQPDLAKELAAARRGEAKALDSLFARNLPPLLAFIRARADAAVTGRESAADLAQSVFREVLQDVDRIELRGEEAFRNWLYMAAMRKLLDRAKSLRRARRDVARELPLPEPGPEADALLACYASICTPSRHAAAREQVARIEAAIRELPEPQRDAVTMSRLMGLSYVQIAGQMGCSESAVRGLVARALATLSARLED